MNKIIFCCILTIFSTSVFSQDSIESKAKIVRKNTDFYIEKRQNEQKNLEDLLQTFKKAGINSRMDFTRRKNSNGSIVESNGKDLEYTTNKDGKIFFKTKQTKQQTIEKYESKILEIQDELKPYISGEKFEFGGNLYTPYQIGKFGYFKDDVHGQYKQVFVRTFQIIDSSKMLVTWGKDMILIKNYPTNGMVDGKLYNLPDLFEVVGTETYQTATGTNTVFVMQPITAKEIKSIELLLQKK